MGKKKDGGNRLGSQSDVQRYLRNERQRTRGSPRADDRRERGRWTPGGSVDGQPAVTRQDGHRVEALWGGSNPEGDGEDHGHIVTNDGLNAASVRYPGEDADAFNDPDDRRQR